jgi:ATP-dependent Clp protease protease subunit
MQGIEDFWLNKGKIFLFGDVTESLALNIVQSLKYTHYRKFKKISLYINSDGGDVYSGNCIVDEILELINNGVNVNTIACGRAHSAAGIILAYGKNRFATENSTIMLHPMSYDSDFDYSKYHKKYSDFSHKIENLSTKQLAKRCGCKSMQEILSFARKVDDSLWLTPKEAITLGIIDNIWSINEERKSK